MPTSYPKPPIDGIFQQNKISMPAAKLRQKAFRDHLIQTFSSRGKGRVWAQKQLDIYWNGRDIAWRLSDPSKTPVQVARFEALQQTTHDALRAVAST